MESRVLKLTKFYHLTSMNSLKLTLDFKYMKLSINFFNPRFFCVVLPQRNSPFIGKFTEERTAGDNRRFNIIECLGICL